MNLQYYPESDMLYIELVKRVSSESEEVASGIVMDFDQQQRVIGIEVEDASKHMDLSRLEITALPIVHLLLSERASVKA